MINIDDSNDIANIQNIIFAEQQRQQRLRNYAYIHNFMTGHMPAEMAVVLNFLYDKNIKSTKFNNIDLENSIFNNVVINNLT